MLVLQHPVEVTVVYFKKLVIALKIFCMCFLDMASNRYRFSPLCVRAKETEGRISGMGIDDSALTICAVAQPVAISIRTRELRGSWESWFHQPGAKRPKRFFARHSEAAV